MTIARENIGAGPQDTSTPQWNTYTTKRVTVYALKGSYAEKRAPADLREADRATEAIGKLLQPAPNRQGHDRQREAEHVDIYLTDPVDPLPATVDPNERSYDDVDLTTRAGRKHIIVRIIEPESPGEPVLRSLVRHFIADWYDLDAEAVPLFTDGIVGVLAARLGTGPSIKEADDAVRSQISAGNSPTILVSDDAGSEGAAIPAATERPIDQQIKWVPNPAATSFVAYLLSSFGEDSVGRFLASYDEERRDQALVDVFQRPLGGLEESWLGDLRRQRLKGSALPIFVRRLIPLVRPYWRQEAELLVYTLFSVGYGFVAPLATKYLIDTVLPNRDVGLLALFIVIILALDVLDVGVSLRSTFVDNWVSQNMLVDLKEKVFNHLQRLAHNFHSEAKVGDIMSRLSSDVSMMQLVMSQLVSSWLHVILSTITAVAVLLALSPLLAVLSAITVPLFAVSYFVFRDRLEQASMQLGRLSGEVNTFLQESLSAYPVIKAFGLEKRTGGAYRFRLVSLLKATLRMNFTSALLNSSTRFVMTLSQLVVLGIGGYLVIQGQITLGDMLAFNLILPTLFLPVMALSGLGQTITSATGALQRIEDVLNEPVSIDDKPGAADLPRLSQEIRVAGLNFGYDSDRTVLDDVNFTVPAGANVAIVGPSGSGKSTMASLLLRFWDPQEGAITFDGHDLRDVTVASLRGQSAIVFQDTFVFDTTVRENIALSRPNATDAEIAEAARGARLDSYIEALPAGYDTVLGERGVRMSGGQRQRLAIARALLRNPSLLLLDEATSALDAKTEKEILDTLAGFTKGRTTISITHRLTVAALADRIYVVDSGKLIEQGTHDELLEAGGLYSRLYDEQVGHLVGTHGRVEIEAAHLRSTPLFATLPADTLASLAEQLLLERYSTGEDVVRQGEPGDKLYIISKGQAEVLLDPGPGQEPVRINVLNKGDYFGEMALLAGGTRTSTVRTTEPSELFSLSQADFLDLLEREPAIRDAVSETVASRRSALAAVYTLAEPVG